MGANTAPARKSKTTEKDVYAKLMKNYDEWRSLMKQLESEGLELRRDYSVLVDRAKMEELKNKIKN
jgi:hypothetical protein